ncbi:MAG: HDIG domain-containing protein, partial [Chloroflexi bacterium]|nr:HDIG domain-containing protein [Chloroflexota bacterium]
VSNMAERAAEAIGADALLARVGSYYHDIGKTLRPYFFGENQSDGDNPHDQLDPRTSAEIILAHPEDGLRLARKYRLPDRVCAFIPEHHGTTLVTYFFRRASQESDNVNEDDFRYAGPKPQSKETAIVMLADSIEAWVRANRPSTQAEMERVIRRVINDRLISGQLDECDLTLKDLDAIREAFISVLQGIFHPRIQYPERSTRRNNRKNASMNATSAAAPNAQAGAAATNPQVKPT